MHTQTLGPIEYNKCSCGPIQILDGPAGIYILSHFYWYCIRDIPSDIFPGRSNAKKESNLNIRNSIYVAVSDCITIFKRSILWFTSIVQYIVNSWNPDLG